MPLPLCDDHMRTHAFRAQHGWPVGADGTDDLCRWCCGLDLDAGCGAARLQVTTLLCDACGKAWCESCLRSGLGNEYVDALLGGGDGEWKCIVCDPQLMGRALAKAGPAAAAAETAAAASAVAAVAAAKAAREAKAALAAEEEVLYLSESAAEMSGEED
eukprot:scaffold34588_cov90-Isochrysis_galbana.AAC.1